LSRAATVEDILRIEKAIGELQMEIESAEGKMRYLKDRISLSTLTVTYYQEADSSFGFFSKLADGIKNGWDGFLWFIIGLSYLWVFILLIVVIFYLIRWGKKKKKSA
jgi:type IV secretory pathway VirB6-like protein